MTFIIYVDCCYRNVFSEWFWWPISCWTILWSKISISFELRVSSDWFDSCLWSVEVDHWGVQEESLPVMVCHGSIGPEIPEFSGSSRIEGLSWKNCQLGVGEVLYSCDVVQLLHSSGHWNDVRIELLEFSDCRLQYLILKDEGVKE